MADTRLERWVSLQRKTWDVDASAKASRIAVEQTGGELVQAFGADTEELGRVIQECIDMQAAELAAGSSHQFRVIAYDPLGKQLAELPQTVRGTSKEASNATQQNMQNARAHHMNVDTMAFVLDKTRAELDAVYARLGDMFDNCTLLTESNATMRLNNEDAQLRRLQFERRMERIDKMMEVAGQLAVPAITILMEKFGPKLLGSTPGEMITKVVAALDSVEKTTPSQGTSEHVEPVGPAPQPSDATLSVVAQPRQDTVRTSTQRRGTGNHRLLPRKRGPKAPPAKTKKRK